MNLFERVYFCCAIMSLLAAGCCNIGCKYDCRKYPTPVFNTQGGPGHIWNPDCASGDIFDKVLPPGYQQSPNLASPPAKMPVGPPQAKASLDAPRWNDPLLGASAANLQGQ